MMRWLWMYLKSDERQASNDGGLLSSLDFVVPDDSVGVKLFFNHECSPPMHWHTNEDPEFRWRLVSARVRCGFMTGIETERLGAGVFSASLSLILWCVRV